MFGSAERISSSTISLLENIPGAEADIFTSDANDVPSEPSNMNVDNNSPTKILIIIYIIQIKKVKDSFIWICK